MVRRFVFLTVIITLQAHGSDIKTSVEKELSAAEMAALTKTGYIKLATRTYPTALLVKIPSFWKSTEEVALTSSMSFRSFNCKA